MTFEEIFEEEGLYRADSFGKGVAIKIKKSTVDNRLELSFVQYDSEKDLTPSTVDVPVYDGLFKKDYTKVLNKKQLFK